MHRAENVDVEPRLAALTAALRRLQEEHRPAGRSCSLHPRTREQDAQPSGSRRATPRSGFLPPFGFFDFVALERDARCVLSDSGTVQEECCIFRVPNVTLRDVTERPETIECGSNMLTGADPDTILACVRAALSHPPAWTPPREYLVENVSDTVVKIVLGYRHVCA